MKKKTDGKSKPATPGDKKNKTNQKDKNAKPEEEQVEQPEPVVEKPKNLERFIYVTTYSDEDAMTKIRELFEEINQSAFQLRSVKEIYTKDLTDEEKDNNEIDYISGVQLLDKNLRITIIEGISGKGLQKVKDKLPKYQMNTKTFMVFSDNRILFNKRIYSKFNLSLKYIKLRDTLTNILTTYDIYMKANKYRDIYNAFLNYGSILKSNSLYEIANANLFPDAESLLQLERKYADILNDEDMTAQKTVKKKKKRHRADSMLTKTSMMGQTNTSLNLSNIPSNLNKDADLSKRAITDTNLPNIQGKKEEEEKNVDVHHMKLKPKLDSHNWEFDEAMKNIIKESKEVTIKKNIDFIKTMKKNPNYVRFCQPVYNVQVTEPIYFYSGQRKNYYNKLVEEMRRKYNSDNNNYYSYSPDHLTLSFPMIENYTNDDYLNSVENKKKWICDKDFDRYVPPPKEKYYFPKINNKL